MRGLQCPVLAAAHSQRERLAVRKVIYDIYARPSEINWVISNTYP
jgi:hypothetical protein